MNTTPFSLLERLSRPESGLAWVRFVELYTPLLCYWARQLGLQDADTADLVQEVFAVLLTELPRFEQRPGRRFRGWLWTLLRNKWRQRRRRASGPPETVADVGELAGPDATEAVDEAEYRKYLVDRALQMMQSDFEPATWKACWECVVVGRPSADVAAELGLTVNAVKLARSRVLRRLREELAGLLDV
jgi:RNA polymerase sigma-70 factor, ECF subfamily